jgi:hypothetical protein
MDTGEKSSWGSAIGLMPGAMFICKTLHPLKVLSYDAES